MLGGDKGYDQQCRPPEERTLCSGSIQFAEAGEHFSFDFWFRNRGLHMRRPGTSTAVGIGVPRGIWLDIRDKSTTVGARV
jgi:hypothetical protein